MMNATLRGCVIITLLLATTAFTKEIPRLTRAKLDEIIKEEKIANTKQLLEYFSRHEHYSKILSHWTPFYDSESGQQDSADPQSDIDPENPRIILYLDDVAIAFTGKKAGSFYNKIEVIDFAAEPDHSVFVPHRRKLNEPPHHPPVGDEMSCTSCHGQTFRPHFPPYDLWPGAYGGLHEQFTVNVRTQGKDGKPSYEEMLVKKERDRFLAFIKNKPSHELYSLLKTKSEIDKDDPTLAYEMSPDSLDIFLARHNNRRILALIKKQETKNGSDAYKYALAFSLVCWDKPISEVFPSEPVQKAHEQSLTKVLSSRYRDDPEFSKLKTEGVLPALQAHSERINKADYKRNQERYLALNEITQKDVVFNDDQEIPTIPLSNFRYILEGMGADPRYFSMSFVPGLESYSFNLGKRDFLDFFSTLYLQDLFERDSSLKALLVENKALYEDKTGIVPGYRLKNSSREFLCEELKKRSRKSLLAPTEKKEEPAKRKTKTSKELGRHR